MTYAPRAHTLDGSEQRTAQHHRDPDFLRDAKGAGITETELWEILSAYARNPLSGDEMQGTGGARKNCFTGYGKGKSGGCRVISYYAGPDVPLFLLNVFSKSQRVNLSQATCNELRKVLSRIAEAYRKGVRNHVQGG